MYGGTPEPQTALGRYQNSGGKCQLGGWGACRYQNSQNLGSSVLPYPTPEGKRNPGTGFASIQIDSDRFLSRRPIIALWHTRGLVYGLYASDIGCHRCCRAAEQLRGWVGSAIHNSIISWSSSLSSDAASAKSNFAYIHAAKGGHHPDKSRQPCTIVVLVGGQEQRERT